MEEHVRAKYIFSDGREVIKEYVSKEDIKTVEEAGIKVEIITGE